MDVEVVVDVVVDGVDDDVIFIDIVVVGGLMEVLSSALLVVCLISVDFRESGGE